MYPFLKASNDNLVIGSNMKDKTLTLKAKGITPKQWSALILELNIMRKEWKPYGVDIQLSAPSIKKIIALGTNAVKDKRTGQDS